MRLILYIASSYTLISSPCWLRISLDYMLRPSAFSSVRPLLYGDIIISPPKGSVVVSIRDLITSQPYPPIP